MDADFDAVAARAEPGRTAATWTGSSSSASPTSAPAFDAFAEEAARYLAPHDLDELQGRLREHHRREGQLEAGLGEQPRVLSLRRQPSVADPHLPRGSEAHRRRRRRRPCRPVLDRHVARCELVGAPSALPDRPDAAAGASCACRCSARPRATPWTARRRSPGRTRTLPVQGRRGAAPLQLSRRPGTTSSPTTRSSSASLPISATETEVRPSGWSTRTQSRASTTT